MHTIKFQTTAEYEGALAHVLSSDATATAERAQVPAKGDELELGGSVWVVDSLKEPHGDERDYTVVVMPTGKASHQVEQ